jgi:hypothetical protein
MFLKKYFCRDHRFHPTLKQYATNESELINWHGKVLMHINKYAQFYINDYLH